jgi:Ser/Thr protein kinase RdoA (MazF antagonist)
VSSGLFDPDVRQKGVVPGAANQGPPGRPAADAAEARDADRVALRHQPSRLGAPDPAEILTHRLTELGDAASMRVLLQEAVDTLRPHAFQVEAYTIDHCKVTPWREIAVALSLTLRSRQTGERSRQIVAGTVFASVDEAERHLQEARRAEPGATAVTWVPAMSLVVRFFPHDQGLPGLAYATDTAAMMALLTAHLPACRDQGWRIRDLAYEPLQYKPGRLCTLRYTLTLEHAGTPDTSRVDVFGKVYRDERWRRSYALLEATWRASVASQGTWTAARPVAVVDHARLIVQSAVAGRQFRHVLGDLTTENASTGDLQQAQAHVTAVARAVRALQQAPISEGPCLDGAMLLAAQDANLEYLRQVHPALARELQELRATIARLAMTCPAAPLAMAHGDFAHGNVLLDAGRVGIIDFDRAGQAEPAYDVAYFLTHLMSFALRHPERAPHVRRLADHFRAAFGALAPAVSPQRLAVYEALDLSAYVLRNFRKRSHQPEWIGWATGQISAAWDRLDTAFTAGRPASL